MLSEFCFGVGQLSEAWGEDFGGVVWVGGVWFVRLSDYSWVEYVEVGVWAVCWDRRWTWWGGIFGRGGKGF